MAAETFANKQVAAPTIIQMSPDFGFDYGLDNGGVIYMGKVATRTGQSNDDYITMQATTDMPHGVVTDIGAEWGYNNPDSVAVDNDPIQVAPVGSGHVVYVFLLSAQGTLFKGRKLYADGAGRVQPLPTSDACATTIHSLMNRYVGVLWNIKVINSTADPKKDMIIMIKLEA